MQAKLYANDINCKTDFSFVFGENVFPANCRQCGDVNAIEWSSKVPRNKYHTYTDDSENNKKSVHVNFPFLTYTLFILFIVDTTYTFIRCL